MGWNEDVRDALNALAAAITGGELAVTLSAPIEADIIDADINAILGTDAGPGNTLAAVCSNLNDGLSVADHLAVIDGFGSYGLDGITMGVHDGMYGVVDYVSGNGGPSAFWGMAGTGLADILDDLTYNSQLNGVSPLYDSTGGTSIADLLLAIKAQTDKLSFDGSSNLNVKTN